MTNWHRKNLTKLAAFVFGLFQLAAQLTFADFVTFGNGAGSKWDDRNFGTPATISWAFMTEGTTIDSTADFGNLAPLISGGSHIASMRTNYDSVNGNGAFNAAIQGALNAWAATTSNIQFIQGTDPGLPVGASGAHTVDIRIGAFTPSSANNAFGNAAAFGYGPPGFDDTFPDSLAGDILFNTNQLFFKAPGVEGQTFDPFQPASGIFQNDLQGLALHELGHAAIGLGHPSFGPDDVMFVGARDARGWFVNRVPSADDMAGAITVYGISAVPEPSSYLLLSVALLVGTIFYRQRNHQSLSRPANQ